MKIFRYISLFTGGFGLDLGIEQAGTNEYSFNLLACVDKTVATRETIRHNRPDITIVGDGENDRDGDLSLLTPEHLLNRAGIKAEEVDLVVGGPPCQTWSVLGKRDGLDDPRGKLILDYVRFVCGIKPKAFILENVKGLTNKNNHTALEYIKTQFHLAGYKALTIWVLNAVSYGVPQYRCRVFIIGFRDGLALPANIPEPSITHYPPPKNGQQGIGTLSEFYHKTVRQALADLPAHVANNEPRHHGTRVENRYNNLLPGTRDKVDHTDRLCWDSPSGTVLVGSAKGGGRPFIHPEYPRHLTVREAARLQGFPDDWVFKGNQTAQYRQVGNAVPPLLAKAVIQQVAPYLLRVITIENSK